MENALSSTRSKSKKMPKPNNMIMVPISMQKEFFKWWCIFLRPFVKLTDKETEVVASFLKQRWELSKEISNPAILDSQLMANETKEKVIADCGMTLQHFYVVMSSLRKNGVIVNNRLNPRLIPNIREDDNGVFQLLILFKGEKVDAV